MQLLLDLLGEQRPVGEPGQRVVVGLVAELLLEPGQLGQRLLELAVLEGDRGLVGERLEQPQVVVVEARALGQAVGDGHRADQPGLAAISGPIIAWRIGRSASRPVGGRIAEERVPLDLDAGVDRVVRRPVDRHHRLRRRVLDRGRPERVAALAAGIEEDLRDLGPEHVAGVVEQGDERGVELRRVLEDPAGLVEQLQPLVLLALGDVRAVGEEQRRRAGRRAARAASGSIHMIETASRARLVLASATMPPNWIISGSFWNCGAPPDSEIAVAIVSAPSDARRRASRRTRRSSRSRPACRSSVPRPWKTTSVTAAMNAKLARLNANLTADWRAVTSRATADPTRTASEVLVRGQEEQPDDGRDLAQRERVGLAPEVDEDDLRLGGHEGGGEERPRDRIGDSGTGGVAGRTVDVDDRPPCRRARP